MSGNQVCSEEMKQYFDTLEREAQRCYAIANDARAKGLDPQTNVEIPLAKDLAARVESLVGPPGIAERIRTVTTECGNREEAALIIAKEVARRSGYKNEEDAMYQAIRTGLAMLTEGVVVAPLEGVIGVKLKRNADGTQYPAVYYAGPIRSAGGGAQALSVLVADIVRRELNLAKYVPTQAELERYMEEIPLYKQAQHLQYIPTKEEVELITRNCPICIDGEGTEEAEVQGYRDLPRVETNRLRGGACLVIAEGLCLKAPKIQKHIKRLKINGWEFIDEYLAKNKGTDAGKQIQSQIAPNKKYIKELLAGRPVFSHPSRRGGFRLRYGRSRTAGLAALSVSPATMFVLDEFLAVGTQMKIERPGKASAITPCDVLDGPILLLKNGDLVQVNDAKTAKAIRPEIKQIVDIGELLVPYGEFAENNHILLDGAYAWEWYAQELAAKVGPEEDIEKFKEIPPGQAFELSEKYGLSLHPRYNLFWHDLTPDDVAILSRYILGRGRLENEKLIIPKSPEIKELLVSLGALHIEREEYIFSEYSLAILRCLGLKPKGERIERLPGTAEVLDLAASFKDTCEFVSKLAGISVAKRGPTRIGGRLGRPEKAKERKMKPAPHSLFPVGTHGGPQRLVTKAADKGEIQVAIGMRRCKSCLKKSIGNRCECGGHTAPIETKMDQRIEARTVDIRQMLHDAIRNLGESGIPEIKGARGLISKNKTPEPLEKGVLRAKNSVFVFKDGTIRFDMTDTPVTHVRVSEIQVTVEKMHSLGYDFDYMGRPLEGSDQIVELKPQDIIVSRNCGAYLVQVSKFLDELLVKFYNQDSFYNATTPDDLIGHLIIGLAPHTSAGVLGRLIGYTPALVGYAHPFFHAAKRRNCDGDEDCIMLLMDGLLNFSESFLPEKRGGRMDAPLVLSASVDPSEIDKEALNLDVGHFYPVEFYKAAQRNATAKEVEEYMDTVGKRIGTPAQYEGFGFTHDTLDIGEGPTESAYKTLGSTEKKLDAQFALGLKLKAVDVPDMAARVIETHFLPDIVGNLKTFSKQKTRCTKCGSKFRRVPLRGICTKCNNPIILTVYEKSVRKYIDIAKRLCERHGVKAYTRQRVALIENAINSLFENGPVRKSRLDEFMGAPGPPPPPKESFALQGEDDGEE